MVEIIDKYFPDLSQKQSAQIDQLLPLYSDWNDKINVISRKDISNLYERHVLHSLSIAKWAQFTPNTKIMDVGCGGGFPSIPLAILFPKTNFHCVDSINKKLTVVSAIAKEFNVTKPTVSDAVRVLHQKGLIEKSPSNADRRAYSVAVSQKGQSVVAQTEQFADPVKSIVEQLGTQTQEQFFIAISKIISLMNKADILTVQRTCFNCRFYSKSEQGHYCKFLTTTLKDEEIRIDCPEHEEA